VSLKKIADESEAAKAGTITAGAGTAE